MEEAYPAWGKTERIGKLYMTITEKIDGTNALVEVLPFDGTNVPEHALKISDDQDGRLFALRAGSRTRWLKPSGKADNFGFAAWVVTNAHELVKLGVGRHYGEWWGSGIQRTYGLTGKRLSLFNTNRPPEPLPACVSQVPVLYKGPIDFNAVQLAMEVLKFGGSKAAPGYNNPEGVIIWLGGQRYKRTFEEGPKSLKEAA